MDNWGVRRSGTLLAIIPPFADIIVIGGDKDHTIMWTLVYICASGKNIWVESLSVTVCGLSSGAQETELETVSIVIPRDVKKKRRTRS